MPIFDTKQIADPMPVVHYDATGKPEPPWPAPTQLRKLPQALQECILAASAELAEQEYRTNQALNDFDALAEEP